MTDRITTPVGVLSFPCFIHEPDTQYRDETNPNDRGEYKARLSLSMAEASNFMAELERLFEEFCARKEIELRRKVKVGDDAMPWYPETDRDTGEETGNIIIRAKMKAAYVSKRTGQVVEQAPKVFDATPVPLVPIPAIGAGTRAKLNVTPSCWYNGGKGAGLTLYLNAVQVLELKEKGGGNTADAFGFDTEEGVRLQNSEFDAVVTDGDY